MKFFPFYLIFLTCLIFSRTLIVPDDYNNIQYAINNSSDTDTILVKSGTYYENIDLLGKNITLASEFLTTHDDAYIQQTVLNGGANGRVLNISNGEDNTTKVVGFTIKNGYTSAYLEGGAGINIIDSDPQILNNVISDNNMDWYGEGCGIFMKRSSSVIRDNIITNNDGAYSGSGIRIDSCSSVIIYNNIIKDHMTMSGYGVANGAGICVSNSTNIEINNNLFTENYVDFGDGDMIVSYNSSVSIDNCTFYNTYNSWSHFALSENTKINNCIIWSDRYFLRSIFTENSSLNITYSNIKENLEGAGNISVDPLFDNFESFDLQQQSPCINSGDPASTNDPDGSRADLGWKYFDLSAYGTISGTVTLGDGMGTLENVLITSGNEKTYPDSTGLYFIHLEPGIHDIIAELGIHSSDSVTSVNLTQGELVTGIDFYLTNVISNGMIEVAQDGSRDFTVIQDAVDFAFNGDSILIYNGIYEKELILIDKSVHLFSNFIFSNDTTDIENTVLDGKNQFRPLYIEDTPDTNLTIEGLTIQNGYSVTKGGGCFIKNSYSNIRNCNITYNHSESNGGGLHNENSKSILTNCQISDNYGSRGGGISNEYLANIKINSSNIINNSGWWGGGIYSYRSEYNIEMCTISYNIGRGYGGGLYEYSSTEKSKLMNSIINYNTSDRSGGGIYFDDLSSESIVMNCIISNNSTTDSISGGGGIVCRESCPILVNNTIVNNTTVKSGGGVTVWSQSRPYSRPSFYNNIIWGNTASEGDQIAIGGEDSDPNFYFCDIQDGNEGFAYTWESSPETNTGDYLNNIDTNPVFFAEDDYRIFNDSPCIDTGTEVLPDSIPIPEFDLNNNPRIYGSTIDIGAYEWQGTGINEPFVPNFTELFQNYPNPFNPHTKIKYTLKETNNVKLSVFNSKGELVTSLFEGYQNKGMHSIDFDASEFNSGIYFYKLTTNSNSQTRKMLLLK